MAIIDIKKASLTRGSAKDGEDSRSVTDVFIVLFDAKPDDFDHVLSLFKTASGLSIGDPFKPGDTRLLKTITPATIESVTDYVIECEYEEPDDDAGAQDENPLLRPDEVSITGSSSQKPYFKDESDEPELVTTSAGEPFETLPQRYVGTFELVIAGNRATLDPSTWASYLYPKCAINTSAFNVRGVPIGAGQGLMKSMRATPIRENGTTYYRMEWTIAVAETWDDEIEDRGYFQLTDDQSGVVAITAANGVDKISRPWPLDGTGYAEAEPSATPAYFTFKPYPKKDFGVFSFTAAA